MLLAVATLFTACNDNDYSWDGSPLSSDPEAAQTVSFGDGSVTEVNPIKLADITGNTVQVCRITPPSVTDEGTNTTYEINFGDKSYSIDANGYMSSSDLVALVENTFGKAPKQNTLTATISAYVDKNGQAVVVTSNQFHVYATPDAPVLSTTGYYVVGNMNGWNAGDTSFKYAFNGQDPYSVQTITITVPAPADGSDPHFKVLNLAKPSTWDDPCVLTALTDKTGNGIASDGNEEGRFTDANAGSDLYCTATAGATYYVLTFDLLNQTWKAKGVNFGTYMYMAGDCNGWSQVDYLYGPNFDGKYTGFMYLNQGGFKFCTEANWDGTNYGAGSVAGSLDANGGNITMSEAAGYYKVDLDLTSLTYTLTPITTIGIIGTATPQGWDASTPMEYNVADRAWELTTTLTDGEMKFRANDAWDINWGGTADNLTQGGANIQVSAGTYTIKLHAYCDTKATFELIPAAGAKRK